MMWRWHGRNYVLRRVYFSHCCEPNRANPMRHGASHIMFSPAVEMQRKQARAREAALEERHPAVLLEYYYVVGLLLSICVPRLRSKSTV